jgi:Kelch motif
MPVPPIARLAAVLLLAAAGPVSAATRTQPVAGSWRALPAMPVRIDAALTSAWTGRELVVFGRRSDIEHPRIVAGVPQYWTTVAAAYDPTRNRWRRLAPPSASNGVGDATALWTGHQVAIVTSFATLLYDPATNRWRALHHGHGGLAVWTGREVVAWGGGCCGDADRDGVALDPRRGTWRRLPPAPLPGSQHPVGAWTGKELLLLAGRRFAGYDPRANRWTRLAAPPVRPGAQAVWTGRELVVFGGYASAGHPVPADAHAYDPATNRWRTLQTMEQGRVNGAAVWTGTRVLVWGGLTGRADTPHVPRHGLAYDPRRDRWTPLRDAPLPGRSAPTGAWTGRSFLVVGGSLGVCGPDGVHGCHTQAFADGAAFTPALR